ncbi:MAG TPA: preprotein translocase subunit YajC [Rhodospirillaceae bacterium]|nr:MAG: preprotein translocase subunit YajC [Alphaproteobacteria bacterium GWF2_58_20]HAU28832.1 preprotein translocase subunit YajC [Rhodospirillaceae bacterium]
MFISTAFAQSAETAATSGNLFMSLMPLLVIIVIFYFLVFVPQKKQAHERLSMLKNLRRGDRVITSGGIFGTIHRLPSDEEAVLEISEGVHVRVLRAHLSTVRLKAGAADETPANTTPEDTVVTPKE